MFWKYCALCHWTYETYKKLSAGFYERVFAFTVVTLMLSSQHQKKLANNQIIMLCSDDTDWNLWAWYLNQRQSLRYIQSKCLANLTAKLTTKTNVDGFLTGQSSLAARSLSKQTFPSGSLFLIHHTSVTDCNTINAFEKRLYSSVCCYTHEDWVETWL